MEAVKDEAKQPAYNPNNKYTWGPEDPFVLSGQEFGVILNSLRAILATPEAQRILIASNANDVIESAFARAVEMGVVKEVKEEKDKSSL